MTFEDVKQILKDAWAAWWIPAVAALVGFLLGGIMF